MRYYEIITESDSDEPLPEDVVKAFENLGSMQRGAPEEAILVGLEQFNQARNCLRNLLQMCPNEEIFKEKAFEYSRNPDGSLRQYSPE